LLREVIAQYPLEIDAYLRLGYQLDYAGQLDAEIAVYKQALGVDPGAQDIYNALGFACSHLGRYDEAIAAHRRYVELAPAEPNAHDSLGLTYNEAGRYGEALAEFEVALSMDPAFHFANLHLGDIYFRLGRYRDAANEYEHYLHYAPSDWDSAQGYHRLTLLYLCTRELSRAKAAAGRELVHGIDLGSSLLVSLARSDTAGMGRLMEKLIDKSAKAGTLSPKQRIYYRGLYALKSGHALEAIDDFKEASRAAPIVWNIDGVEDCLANAYLELGRLDEAIIEYDRLLAINPNYPLAHFHLAQAYQQKGDIERARHEYETFLHIWKDADANIPEVAAAMQLTGSHSNQRSPTAPAL
jgi:tetratricopeptide (TPR) repeat protein